MLIDNIDNLSDLQKDALKELGTMGAGHAASALTEFLNQIIFMKVPSVQIIKVNTIPNVLKTRFRAEAQLAISSANNLTELFYTVLVLFDKETVNEILDQKSPPSDDIEAIMEYSTLTMSLIKEIGSIILLKIVSTLNQFLNISGAFPSIPELRIGILDSLLLNELKEFQPDSKVIFIKCDIFSEDKAEIRADCIFIPHTETCGRFFGALFTQYL